MSTENKHDLIHDAANFQVYLWFSRLLTGTMECLLEQP